MSPRIPDIRLIEVCRLAALGRAVEIAAAHQIVSAWQSRTLASKRTIPSRQIWLALAVLAAHRHETTVRAVIGRSTRKAACEARHEAWAQLRGHGYSLPGIGRAVNRHHTAILYGLRRNAGECGKRGRPAERLRA